MPLHKDEGQAQNEALDVLSTRAALEIESAMHRLHAFMRVSTEEHDTETATGLPDLPQPPPRSSSFKRLVADEASRKAWTAKVESALDLIRRKAFDKIVLARELRMAIPGGAPAAATGMLDYLIEAFPDCSIFLKRTDSRACFIGASPERLIKAGNGTLTTDALAGSISRGMDEQEDRRLAERLLTDEKENLEHQFVVRQITQTLSDLADSISHPSTPVIKKLRNLQHLHTPITAKAANGIHLHGILEQLHPTPAVGGYPRRQAVPHIRNIEQIDRGWYSGIVGWQGMGQDGDFAVAIRSALLSGTTARLFAGCGIVASSDPEMEWQETCLKAAPLADALESAVRKTQ
jgi:menaquinone-specific isochorismate synthase